MPISPPRIPIAPILQVDLAVATLNRQQEADDRDAQQILQRVPSADPENLRAHYSLGLVLLNDGRAADARPHFARVAERDPNEATRTTTSASRRFRPAIPPARSPRTSVRSR